MTKKLKDYGMEQTHIVLKIEDVKKHITEHDQRELAEIEKHITNGRKYNGKDPDPEYLVVNTDEPYADRIANAIKIGEMVKDGSLVGMKVQLWDLTDCIVSKITSDNQAVYLKDYFDFDLGWYDVGEIAEVINSA